MFYPNDVIPRIQSAGADAVFTSLAYQFISHPPTFLAALNSQLAPITVSLRAALQYYAERPELQAALGVYEDEIRELYPGIEVYPVATPRCPAPTGLGTDGSAVWCTVEGGTSETTIVRWYVMGALRARKIGEFANSATLAELATGMGDDPIEIVPGNKIQVCVESGGVVGWWTRIELP